MYGIRTTKEVLKIVDSKDNIIDQMLALQKNSRKKGVRQYIDRLVNKYRPYYSDAESKYILYCIVKYFYGLEVNEVKAPLPKLPIAGYYTERNYDAESINKLLNQRKDIIEQCKFLRKQKNQKGMKEYFDFVFETYQYDVELGGQSRDFEIFCINKYFYGLDVAEVEPRPLDLRPYTMLFEKKVHKEITEHMDFQEIKEGDKVKVVDGEFANSSGYVSHIDQETQTLTLVIDCFGQELSVDLDGKYSLFRKVDDE